MIRALFFDWGNTVMTDFGHPQPMYLWEKVEWVSGAERALKELSKQYDCYVATNAPMSDGAAVLKALSRVGADRYFRMIFSSFDIGFEKPDPAFFRHVLKEASVGPEEAVMIGDNYRKDISGAKARGMKTVFLNRTGKEGP
ncbi:MAG TPA: HAD family hydrolase, partial [Bacteroidales bacterium]|nr:HAD family hydrolase [Bacteroidales bacterium]